MSTKVKDDPDSDYNEKKEMCTENVEIKQEKKPDIPTKSSMEILSELFSTFDAEPPVIIKKEKSEESVGKKHKKKKKHKHKDKKHKKKSKKRHRSNSSSSEDEGKVDLAQILIKQEKDSSAKKIKIQGTDLSLNLDVNTPDVVKNEESYESDSKTPVGSPKSGVKKSKIVIQDLKKSSVFETLLKESEKDELNSNNKEKKHKKKHKQKSKKRSRSKSKDRHDTKKVKINDLRDILKEKESKHTKHKYSDKSSNDDYDEKSHHKSKERERSREKHYDKLYDKYKDEYYRTLDDYKKSRKDNPFYKSYKDEMSYQSNERDRDFRRSNRDRYRDADKRYRSPSRDRNDRESSSKFDKKKLLEIARKNAIAMMKSGSLPAALTLGPQAQEKVIAAIKSGGKTIEELTDFCKTLSKKEELGELSSLSEKDDSDSDADRPFHHPFQIKERPTTITMNIKNSVPLPIKSSLERTTELRMQFPVSSGQHHRKGEEWRPVSPAKKEEKIPIVMPPTVPVVMPANVPVVMPTTVPVAKPTPVPVVMPTTVLTSSIPLPPDPTPKPLSNFNSLGSTIPQPELATTESSNNVIPSHNFGLAAKANVDIGAIVSQRLAAIRKLQENPNDVLALTQMYKSNKEMQTWASSKQAPLGQFKGSTGAQILSQSELSSGYQAWAKKAIILYQGAPKGNVSIQSISLWISFKQQHPYLVVWECIFYKKWVGNLEKD